MKKAVVTGASSGIGFAIAKALVQRKIEVVALCRTKPDLECEHIPTDFSDAEGVELAAKQIFEQHPDVDVLINNAGMFGPRGQDDLEYDEVQKVFNTNVVGHIVLTSTLLETIVKNKGDIITMGSINSLQGNQDYPTYAATKWALKGYMDSLVLYCKDKDVRVCTVCPAGMQTKFFEGSQYDRNVKEFMDPDQIAEYVMRALEMDRNIEVSLLRIDRNKMADMNK